MKAIIPAAGAGQRLRPFTFSKPKPLITVAGRPIICHILDSLEGIVRDVVIVVGYMKEKLTSFLSEYYQDKFNFTFVDQEQRLGLGHAIHLALPYINGEPALITLGDEFFTMGFDEMIEVHRQGGPGRDATLGTKKVKDASRYGIAELEGTRILRMEEKPEHPTTEIALAGLYIIENTLLLEDCLSELISGEVDREYELTDGLQLMIEKGAWIDSFHIDEWYDCGRPEMLVEVNSLLLGKEGTSIRSPLHNTIIEEPVIIDAGCVISDSVIGPNVSIDSDTKIINCNIENSIIGTGTVIENEILTDSIIGDFVRLMGKKKRMHVGDSTDISAE